MMRVLVTGAQGFIGKNLLLKLCENDIEVLQFNRGDNIKNLFDIVEISSIFSPIRSISSSIIYIY